jgi:hypothetical protein
LPSLDRRRPELQVSASVGVYRRRRWDLRPGNALNKPGSHVMLFRRFTPDRRLARGYQPVWFRALADGKLVIS